MVSLMAVDILRTLNPKTNVTIVAPKRDKSLEPGWPTNPSLLLHWYGL